MKQLYLTFLFTILAINLFAQSKKDSIINMNDVVINENRFNTPISKQNRNVYIIDNATIAKLPARTIQEVLQYANGIDIRQRGAFGGQADISIDGGSFEQTVLLLNGTKIIDMQTAHNMLNLPIPVEAIERIEIIRGPAARIYGINSLTGAINIITKKPATSGVLFSTYAGSNFEKNTEGNGKTFVGGGVQVGGMLSKEKHQHSLFASHDKGNGYRFNTGFENNKLLYLGNFQIDESNTIDALFGYVKSGFGANGFYASPGDKNSDEQVQTTLASLQSKHKLSERWTLMPRLSYRYNFDDYRYFGPTNLNSGRSRHFSNSFSAELNTTYKISSGEFGFGAEARKDDINSTSIGKRDRDNLGVYAQYRTQLLEKLNVNIGTYLNYNSDYKWQIYPGLDASYEISTGIKLVTNIGTSQRNPSFTDLYLNQRPGNIGNENLTPENALQAELGIKIDKGNFNFNANYFYRTIDKFIDWTRTVTTEPWQSNNIGDLQTSGLNFRANYNFAIADKSKVNINLGYSYLDSDFKNLNSQLAYKYLISSLKHQVTNTVDFRYVNFAVLLATRFNQRMAGPSYWINDIRLSQSIKKFTVFLDAQNIFDTTYTEIGAIPLPSRWLSLGVKFVSF
ncbi:MULTISPECIES: TonB-dependent siderophore receptor [unclassified Pedobacter]|uniref:TonB-dependent receptor plug domain-containing protein n=1 Tax=unclassified Pedobacter TaxID=2628915 RepID=UPI001E4CB251|nr:MULTISPECIES: TonB-dependent receptor [unclassified Pedobacter]